MIAPVHNSYRQRGALRNFTSFDANVDSVFKKHRKQKRGKIQTRGESRASKWLKRSLSKSVPSPSSLGPHDVSVEGREFSLPFHVDFALAVSLPQPIIPPSSWFDMDTKKNNRRTEERS